MFQESDVYFMSTACVRPLGEGISLLWTTEEGQNPDFLVDIINGWLPLRQFENALTQ